MIANSIVSEKDKEKTKPTSFKHTDGKQKHVSSPPWVCWESHTVSASSRRRKVWGWYSAEGNIKSCFY